jgi:hypothetical protein
VPKPRAFLISALIAVAANTAFAWFYVEELRPLFTPRPTLDELRSIETAIAKATPLDLKTRLTGVLMAQRERDEATLEALDLFAEVIAALVIAIAGLLVYFYAVSRKTR